VSRATPVKLLDEEVKSTVGLSSGLLLLLQLTIDIISKSEKTLNTFLVNSGG